MRKILDSADSRTGTDTSSAMKLSQDSSIRRYEILACLALLLAGILINYRTVVSRPYDRENIGTADLWTGFGPYGYFMDRSVHSGEVPLWNPLILCGIPFAANPQAKLFYPPNVARSLLTFEPTPAATLFSIKVLVAFHILVAGLGTYVLARRNGLTVIAGLLSAFVFVFSANFVRRACANHYVDVVAWMPSLLFFLDRACSSSEWRGRWWNAGLAVAALALCTLAGYTQLTIYVGIAAAAYVVVRSVMIGERGVKRVVSNLALFVAVAICALLLSAVALIPAAELFQLSSRTSRDALSEAMSYTVGSCADFCKLLFMYGGIRPRLPGLCSASIFVLLLCAVWTRNRTRAAMWGVILLPLVDLSIGIPMPLSSIIDHVLPFRLVHPFRALLVLCLPLSILVGFGLDALAHTLVSRRMRVARWAYVAVCAGAVTFVTWRLRNSALALLADFGTHLLVPRAVLLLPGILVLLLVAAEYFRRLRWFPAFALALVAVELAIWNGLYVPHLLNPWAELYRADLDQPATAQPQNLRHTDEAPNLLMYTLTPSMTGYEPAIPAASWKLLCASGQESAYARTVTPSDVTRENSYGSLFLWRPFWLVDNYSTEPFPPKDVRFSPESTAYVESDAEMSVVPRRSPDGAKEANSASVKVLASPQTARWSSGGDVAEFTIEFPVSLSIAGEIEMTLSSSAPGFVWPEFTDKLSHGTFSSRPLAIAGTGTTEVLSFPYPGIAESTFVIRVSSEAAQGQVTLEDVRVTDAAPDEADRVVVRSWSANEARVFINDVPSPRLLLFTDTMYPGWRAYVDGKRVPLIRANGAFKAVEVPAGTHEVRFAFLPASVLAGLGISFAALLGLVVVLFKARPRVVIRSGGAG